jgi:hypothetical protein
VVAPAIFGLCFGQSSTKHLPRNSRPAAEFHPLLFSTGARDTMATQIVMDHTGDTRHMFDPVDAKAVAEAERRFRELIGTGFTAAVRRAEGKSEVLRTFDPTAEETLFVPRLKGG